MVSQDLERTKVMANANEAKLNVMRSFMLRSAVLSIITPVVIKQATHMRVKEGRHRELGRRGSFLMRKPSWLLV